MTLSDADAKTFVKLMDSICGRHARWEIWKDAMWLWATAISNSVDARQRERREEQYMHIARNYTAEELNTFAGMFAHLVDTMERGCGKSRYQDFLGKLFMVLELGNDAGGQFFTPYDVCRMMAGVALEDMGERVKRQGYIAVNDCACGAGATLIAAADIMYFDQHINYQQDALFVGQDIDYTTALMCYIQMSLLGCAGYVRVGNTLTDPMTGHTLFGDGGPDTWYTPMYFAPVWEMRRQAAYLRHALGLLEQPKAPEAAEAPEPAAPEPEIPIIQVSGKKSRRKPEGQLMFGV